MLLVSGATRTMNRLAVKYPKHLGHLFTPVDGNDVGNLISTGLRWACDNAAFTNFRLGQYLDMICQKAPLADRPPLFITLPDKVADAQKTTGDLRKRQIGLFYQWQPVVSSYGMPVAMVGQDGLEDMHVPWNLMDAFFIGGSTEWKLSASVRDLVAEAKRRGKWVHMGRVNTKRRMKYAYQIGCDSVDGSSLSKFSETYVPKFARYLIELHQRGLFDGDGEAGQPTDSSNGPDHHPGRSRAGGDSLQGRRAPRGWSVGDRRRVVHLRPHGHSAVTQCRLPPALQEPVYAAV